MPNDEIPIALSKIPAAAKAIEVVTYLARDAFIDAKTSLLNEAALNVLTKEYSAAGANERLAVIFLDVREFKHINAVLGYIGADAALRRVATAILQTVDDAKADCFRQHGDEFVIFLPAEKAESALIERAGNACSIAKEMGSRSAVAWHADIEKELIDQDRQRCGVCSATTTLLVRVSQRQPGSLSLCSNCGAPFGR